MNRRSGVAGVALALMGTATAALASSLPVAIDDHVAGSGGTLHIYVLANDSGDFDPSTLALASQPSQGQATVIATGSPRIKYSSASGGNDSFSYRICNSAGMCATATVTVGATATTTSTTSSTTTTTITTTTTTTAAVSPTAPPPTQITALPTPTVPVTTNPPVITTTSAVATTVTTEQRDPAVDALLAAGEGISRAGTTVGERRGFDFAEDLTFLGRSGTETLELVAVPAVLVSGVVGFLLLGLPQNLFGSLLGFFVAFRRRKKDKHPDLTQT